MIYIYDMHLKRLYTNVNRSINSNNNSYWSADASPSARWCTTRCNVPSPNPITTTYCLECCATKYCTSCEWKTIVSVSSCQCHYLFCVRPPVILHCSYSVALTPIRGYLTVDCNQSLVKHAVLNSRTTDLLNMYQWDYWPAGAAEGVTCCIHDTLWVWDACKWRCTSSEVSAMWHIRPIIGFLTVAVFCSTIAGVVYTRLQKVSGENM